MKPLRILCRLHDLITDAGFLIGIASLAAMVSIYCAEITTRYFLGSALDWANDTFSNILCVMIFATIPEAARSARHIDINLIPELVPSARYPLALFGSVAGFVICAAMAWMSLDVNIRQVARGILTAQNHPIPVVWMSSFITYGFGSSALYFLRRIFPAGDLQTKSLFAGSAGHTSSSIG